MAENAELALTLPLFMDLALVVHCPDMTGARAAEGPDVDERASDGRPRLGPWKWPPPPPPPKAWGAPCWDPPGEVSNEERPERSGMSPASE